MPVGRLVFAGRNGQRAILPGLVSTGAAPTRKRLLGGVINWFVRISIRIRPVRGRGGSVGLSPGSAHQRTRQGFPGRLAAQARRAAPVRRSWRASEALDACAGGPSRNL